VAAGEEIAATAVVGVVGAEWVEEAEDGAVVVRRPRRRDEKRARRYGFFFHENDYIKTIPGLRQWFLYGSGGSYFLLWYLACDGLLYLCCFIASGDDTDRCCELVLTVLDTAT
jgi:hypothetical protein